MNLRQKKKTAVNYYKSQFFSGNLDFDLEQRPCNPDLISNVNHKTFLLFCVGLSQVF